MAGEIAWRCRDGHAGQIKRRSRTLMITEKSVNNDPLSKDKTSYQSPWGQIQDVVPGKPMEGAAGIPRTQVFPARTSAVDEASVATYLKQVYALLAASLAISVSAGYVGMRLPFAYEHPIIMCLLFLGAVMLCSYVKNTATLFLAAGLGGLSVGPMIAYYVNAGMSSIVGQAAFMTGGAFAGLSFYALTTKRDLSRMGGMLFAGLMVLIVGGLVNLFMQSSALSFAFAAMGAVVFSGLIIWETQMLKENPWAVPPAAAALSMFLNVFNLFLSLLRLLGFLGGED
jgi:modulator of FtsH protease